MEDQISGYGLRRPTRSTVIAALHSVLGPFDGDRAWTDACMAARVDPQDMGMGIAALTAVVDVLSRAPGLPGVVGDSMWIRLESYELLARRQRAQAARHAR